MFIWKGTAIVWPVVVQKPRERIYLDEDGAEDCRRRTSCAPQTVRSKISSGRYDTYFYIWWHDDRLMSRSINWIIAQISASSARPLHSSHCVSHHILEWIQSLASNSNSSLFTTDKSFSTDWWFLIHLSIRNKSFFYSCCTVEKWSPSCCWSTADCCSSLQFLVCFLLQHSINIYLYSLKLWLFIQWMQWKMNRTLSASWIT